MTMNNEGLKYELQELGAIGDDMLLALFIYLFFSVATVRQREARLWLTCTSCVT